LGLALREKMDMPSDFYEQQPSPSVRGTKANGNSQPLLTSDEVMAGTKVVMTHAERQAFLKTSRLGEIFGVAHLLPEVEEVTNKAAQKSSSLKSLRGLFKRGLQKKDELSYNHNKVAKRDN